MFHEKNPFSFTIRGMLIMMLSLSVLSKLSEAASFVVSVSANGSARPSPMQLAPGSTPIAVDRRYNLLGVSPRNMYRLLHYCNLCMWPDAL